MRLAFGWVVMCSQIAPTLATTGIDKGKRKKKK